MAMKLGLVWAFAMAMGSVEASAEAPVPNTHVLSADDLAFNAAAKEARRTLPQFVAKWQAKPSGYRAFRVKVEFRTDDGRGVEDLWIEPTDIAAGGAVSGAVSGSAATRIAKLKQGSEVHARAEQVVDWMYLRDARMYGQFTLRAQLGRMPPEQRAQYEAVLATTPLEPAAH